MATMVVVLSSFAHTCLHISNAEDRALPFRLNANGEEDLGSGQKERKEKRCASGGSHWAQGRTPTPSPPPRGPNSFIFMQFSAKNFGMGNPGSATASIIKERG